MRVRIKSYINAVFTFTFNMLSKENKRNFAVFVYKSVMSLGDK